jgi:hypothetical protein
LLISKPTSFLKRRWIKILLPTTHWFNTMSRRELSELSDLNGLHRCFAGSITTILPFACWMLDVGSADGYLPGSLAARGYQVTASDFAPGMADASRRNAPDVTVLCDEFLSHDFGEQRFDIVLLIAFVHLFPPPFDALVIRKVGALLSTRGVGFASTTLDDPPSGGYARKNAGREQLIRYRGHYSVQSFNDVIERAGLKAYSVETVTDWMYPGKTWIDCIFGKLISSRPGMLDVIGHPNYQS